MTENISKQYRLGNVGLGSLSHDINRWYQTTLRGKEDPYLKIGNQQPLPKRIKRIRMGLARY